MASEDFETLMKRFYSALQQQGDTSDILSKFSQLHTDMERIQFLERLPEAQLLQVCLESSTSEAGANHSTCADALRAPTIRSAAISEQMRNSGNANFCRKDYRLAVDMYTEAIESAPLPSASKSSSPPHLALALANRSAAFFQLGSYQRCREDVEEALKNDYPPAQRCKLHERLGEASSRLGEGRAAERAFCAALLSAREAKLDQDGTRRMLTKLDTLICNSATERMRRMLNGGVDGEDNGAPNSSVLKRSRQRFGRNKTNKAKGPVADTAEALPSSGDTFALNDSQTNAISVPQLTHGQHADLAAASDAVHLQTDDIRGRMLVAATDLRPGDVVIAELPFCFSLLPECWETHCFHCCRRLEQEQRVPCSRGCQVIFCSEVCSISSSPLHRLECDILPRLISLDLGPMSLLSVRLVLSAGPQQLRQARLASCNNNRITPPLATAHTLVGNADKRSPADLFRRTSIAFCLASLLQDNPVVKAEKADVANMSEGFANRMGSSSKGQSPVEPNNSSPINSEEHTMSREEKLNEYACGLLHYLQSLPCNAHEISEQVTLSDGNTEIHEIGAGVYPTVSLMNHLCDANVLRISYGNACVVRVIRPIKRGEEILDNYGFHFAVQSLAQRQSALSRQYHFTCRCQACHENWPTHQQLPRKECFKCSMCATPTDHCRHAPNSQIYRQYLQSKESYRTTSRVLRSGQSEVAIAESIRHLETLDRVLVRPSREYNQCQEDIKFVFISAGNHVVQELSKLEKDKGLHNYPDAPQKAQENNVDNCILRIYGHNVANKCQ